MRLGQMEPLKIAADSIERRLESPAEAPIAKSLRDVGFGSVVDLLATYAGQRGDLLPWIEGAQINRDGNLRLQYMAGLALNTSMEGAIYSEILSYRRYPQNMIEASPPIEQALRVRAIPRGGVARFPRTHRRFPHHRNSARSNRKLHRSEEHTSELQSLRHLVCRLLLEKKK